MTSPLQVLSFMAITLAPPGTHHIDISAGSESYSFDRSDSGSETSTWVYDEAESPRQTLINNDVAPRHISQAEKMIVDQSHHEWGSHPVLVFDPVHQLEKTGQGYVYVVRPGSPNEKVYSITYRP